ncbi:hypothetical protein HZS_4460 [Henneguya salminicola]|nr:hypothetical protein HZS_4460 [Henneguya salminicola]
MANSYYKPLTDYEIFKLIVETGYPPTTDDKWTEPVPTMQKLASRKLIKKSRTKYTGTAH